jgi:nuclear GTP-binding protein
VPNSFPFKERILREIEKSRESREVERRSRKESAQGHDTMEEVADLGMARLAQLAEERDIEFEQDDTVMADGLENLEEPSTKNDTSRKAYTKEFKKFVEQADVVFDARDPEGTRSKDVETMIRESPHGEKQLLLILNKIGNSPSSLSNEDLIPPTTLNSWLLYLHRSFPVLPFHSNSKPQFTHPNFPHKKLSLLLHSALKSHSSTLKRSLAVGIVGFLNTGKSSIINPLTCRLGSRR